MEDIDPMDQVEKLILLTFSNILGAIVQLRYQMPEPVDLPGLEAASASLQELRDLLQQMHQERD